MYDERVCVRGCVYVNRLCVRGCVLRGCVAAFFKLRWRSRYSDRVG